MMRATLACVAAAALMASGPAQPPTAKTLDIYAIDVEGGKATLFVSPSGESLLIDTGSPGGRDTDRITAVLAEAGIKQLDFVLLTHYHVDHIGGLQELATRIPIRTFIDHGPSVEEQEQVQGFHKAYAGLYAKAKHSVVKPGDRVPIAGLEWTIVTSAGQVLKKPLEGGGKPNQYCAEFKPRENSRDPENGQSVGSVIVYGRFRAIDLGDLLWNNEADLMCPKNPVGTVDLYLTSHHGTDPSGSEVLVHALRPRVAITQNGMRKGATVQTSRIINSSPGFENIWQLHWSYTGGIEHNPAGLFIANVDEPATIATILASPAAGSGGTGGTGAVSAAAAARSGAIQAPAAASPTPPAGAALRGGRGSAHAGPAFWIKVSAHQDGSFTVTNTRNGFTKTYLRR
jgi:competence protein ComEC